jgi:copper homeostasis protein CutC
MSVCLIRTKASKEEIEDMLKFLETYIKVAVDIRQEILAGGGVMRADCEAMLLENRSQQKDIWGANWDPETETVQFDALINIRPRDNNRSIEIQDSSIRTKVQQVVRKLLSKS